MLFGLFGVFVSFFLGSCSREFIQDETEPMVGVLVNGTLLDERDNRSYTTATIGTQTWMTQNLAYLPSVNPNSDGSTTEKRYYVFGYNGTNVAEARATSNCKTYGVLYNFPAALDRSPGSNAVPPGVKGICPAGWHLPSDEEWKNWKGTLV